MKSSQEYIFLLFWHEASKRVFKSSEPRFSTFARKTAIEGQVYALTFTN